MEAPHTHAKPHAQQQPHEYGYDEYITKRAWSATVIMLSVPVNHTWSATAAFVHGYLHETTKQDTLFTFKSVCGRQP